MENKIKERVEMLKAMETVCRNINDEEVFMDWLVYGVADGDIPRMSDEELAEYYCENVQQFADIMDCFLRCMRGAIRSGGLWAGRVCSNIGNDDEEE